MKRLSGAILATFLASSGALADGANLTRTMWTCTRARDGSQFLIAFYPGGGVGGGEMERREVSPYVFDASRTPSGSWPGAWTLTDPNFTWEFPDQHMKIVGRIRTTRQGSTLSGTETGLGLTSSVTCRPQSRLPRIGNGLVIPRDGHFMDADDEEGELKVPTGISLQPPGNAR